MKNTLSQFQYQSSFSLKNKVALVTGAGGYLGAYMAFSLGQAGAHVLLNGRNEEKLKNTQDILNEHHIESTILCFDITNASLVKENVDYIEKNFKYLDVIINNAHSGRACHFQDSKADDFLRDFNVDVVASFELIKSSLSILKKAVAVNGDASVINIASMYGMVSPDPRIYSDSKMNNPPHYGVAKAGLIQLTKYMACHLAQDKIRVNAISPGPFPPSEVMEKNNDFQKQLVSKVPLERVGCPSELQGPVLFLASSASSYITGINIPVDGGWTAW